MSPHAEIEEVTEIGRPSELWCYRHEAMSPVERAWIAWGPGRRTRIEYVTLGCGCTLDSREVRKHVPR